jgi:VIT1/CCC1 family predicted Fe2+/Mn2+ transporter
VPAALPVAALLTGVALFTIGGLKSRWTGRPLVSSGIQVLAVGAFAGAAGYLFGTVLPSLLGVSPAA